MCCVLCVLGRRSFYERCAVVCCVARACERERRESAWRELVAVLRFVVAEEGVDLTLPNERVVNQERRRTDRARACGRRADRPLRHRHRQKWPPPPRPANASLRLCRCVRSTTERSISPLVLPTSPKPHANNAALSSYPNAFLLLARRPARRRASRSPSTDRRWVASRARTRAQRVAVSWRLSRKVRRRGGEPHLQYSRRRAGYGRGGVRLPQDPFVRRSNDGPRREQAGAAWRFARRVRLARGTARRHRLL